MRIGLAMLAMVSVLASCSGEEPPGTSGETQRFPDVVDVDVTETGDNVYRFDVTISSPYDTPERYADAWRVKSEDGTVYGIRELLHDHAGEQPFTRSLSDVRIPAGTERVIIEGRDLEYGWGGDTLTVELR